MTRYVQGTLFDQVEEASEVILVAPEVVLKQAFCLQTGDVVTDTTGAKILVRTVQLLGNKVVLTAFGHDRLARWYFQKDAWVSVEELTFTAEEV